MIAQFRRLSGKMEEVPHGERAEGAEVPHDERAEGAVGGRAEGTGATQTVISVSAQTVPGPAPPRRGEEPHVRGVPTSGYALLEWARPRTQVSKGQGLNGK